MTQIIDRAIVEQALETIEDLTHNKLFTAEWAGKHGATIAALRAVLAEPQPNTLHGWVFKRNADGSVGIFAPPPKPGESRRTSDCVGPQDRDLNELLGKLADHMAALPEPVQEPVAWYQKRGQEVLTSHPACWGREDEPWTPLYTAPPQRLPLTSDKDRPDQGTTYVEGYGYVDTRAARSTSSGRMESRSEHERPDTSRPAGAGGVGSRAER